MVFKSIVSIHRRESQYSQLLQVHYYQPSNKTTLETYLAKLTSLQFDMWEDGKKGEEQ